MHSRIRSAGLPLVLLLAALVAGCREDETGNAPDLSNNNGLFQRYVSLGNSITAGFQSAGINDSTQQRSYTVLVAQQAGAPFFVPSMRLPGCPPPFTQNTTQTRVGGGGPATCALRAPNNYPYVSNLGVPGASARDIVSNFASPSASNALTQFILGGRSQLRAMTDAQPTFVSVWIGNNDVLGSVTNSANPGNVALITPVAQFQTTYQQIVDSVAATGASAILIGVADVANIPYSSVGAVYWCLKNGGCPPPLPPANPNFSLNPSFQVALSCAPIPPAGGGLATRVPWTVGIAGFLNTIGTPGFTFTLDCANEAHAITAAELQALGTAVAGYNAFIAAKAAEHGWAYVDPNPTLASGYLNGTSVLAFPDLTQVQTTGNVLFGTWFSLDGVHPSNTAHRIIADTIISAVNRTYTTSIPFAGP